MTTSEAGRRGGQRGGVIRAQRLSHERMAEIGRMGAIARWGSHVSHPVSTWKRSRYQQHKYEGLCVDCSQAVSEFSTVLCDECRAKRLNRNRIRRSTGSWQPNGPGRPPNEVLMNTEVGPLASPLARVIDRKLLQEGGQALRHKMVEGKAQFWVVRGNGATLASPSLHEMAKTLGLQPKKEPMTQPETMTPKRAASITGYSASRISRAIQEQEITVVAPPRGIRPAQLSSESVMRWAERTKGLGPRFRPRAKHPRQVPAKVPVTAEGAQNPASLIQRMNKRGDRLDRYLLKFRGTPFEISREQFIEKLIDQALDKLEA